MQIGIETPTRATVAKLKAQLRREEEAENWPAVSPLRKKIAEDSQRLRIIERNFANREAREAALAAYNEKRARFEAAIASLEGAIAAVNRRPGLQDAMLENDREILDAMRKLQSLNLYADISGGIEPAGITGLFAHAFADRAATLGDPSMPVVRGMRHRPDMLPDAGVVVGDRLRGLIATLRREMAKEKFPL